MAVGCGAETTTKGRDTRDFAGQGRRSLDLLPQANVADGTPLKRQFQHQYDSGHRLITEWVATDTTVGTAFTLGTDFNAAPSSANLATVAYAMNLVGNRGSRTKAVAGGLVEFFSNDALGTTRFLTRFDPGVTSLDGQLGELTTQTFTYDAYGLLASGSATATAYLYTGEQWDNDVGAYYLRARWYLPEWGRFLSRDSFEGTPNDPLSLHKFLYASANPVNLVDPSGHDPGVGTLPGLLGGIGIRGVGEGLRLPTVSASFVKAAITVGVVAVAVTSDTPDRSDRNAMRLQLQEGNNHYWSLVMSEEARGIGVVSPQVYAALSSLHFAATIEAMLLDFPTSLEPELYGAIIRFSSRIRPIVAGGGVVQGGNVLREEFRGNGRTYRIDLENLRGHNLRR